MANGFPARVREKLEPSNDLVVLVAVVLAIPMAYAVSSVTGDTPASFLALMLAGVLVPRVYEDQWPVEYGVSLAAVAWAGVAVCLATGTLLGVYVLVFPVFDGLTASAGFASATVAFLAAWLLGAGVARTLGPRLTAFTGTAQSGR